MTLLAEYRNRRAHGPSSAAYVVGPLPPVNGISTSEASPTTAAPAPSARTMRATAYWTWIDAWDDEGYALVDLTGGHLPPCPRAWADQIGPCLCVGGRER